MFLKWKAPGNRRNLNRAEVVDQNFRHFVQHYQPESQVALKMPAEDLLELFESQMISRQLDLMARQLRLENKVFYTIGSSGHEGNAMVGRLTRATDPALLHYRSGGFMAERYRQRPDMDFIHDTALSFAASADDPASGGRHKVWGSKPLWVIPQTSTIASHLPKAGGMAMAIEHGPRIGVNLPVPEDSIVICSFGDASANHSTAQGAFNAAQWAAHQQLRVPVLWVCEDNGIGISVKTPENWIAETFSNRAHVHYFQADGLDLERGWPVVKQAVDTCRNLRCPVFLHLRTTRLMGHAGTDFEIRHRALAEVEQAEALDPLLFSAKRVMDAGLMSGEEILRRYEALAEACMQKARAADRQARLTTLEQVQAPLHQRDKPRIAHRASQVVPEDQRAAFWSRLPEEGDPRHMAILLNQGLQDLMLQYENSVLFGEDVAQKGGVYTITRDIYRKLGPRRIFNTLLDEQTILGMAQGYASMGFLPVPEIQYLAYFHNACDQIRGEAASLQFFSNGQFSNPMVVRIPGLGYQKGFGGHFHNDNSIAALRDIPGLVVACPSRGDEAVLMLRTLMAAAAECGQVSAFIEPIALYMRKDLYRAGDEGWCFRYPPPGRFIPLGEPGFYGDEQAELLVITFGNGVPMSLQAAAQAGIHARIMDLRWLLPLNEPAILEAAAQARQVLVVDEGRYSGGVGEAVLALLAQHAPWRPMRRISGADCYTPLGDAAGLVLPSVASIGEAMRELASG